MLGLFCYYTKEIYLSGGNTIRHIQFDFKMLILLILFRIIRNNMDTKEEQPLVFFSSTLASIIPIDCCHPKIEINLNKKVPQTGCLCCFDKCWYFIPEVMANDRMQKVNRKCFPSTLSSLVCWVRWAVQKASSFKPHTSGEGIHKDGNFSPTWKWMCDLSMYLASGALKWKLADCPVFFSNSGTEVAKCQAAGLCTKWLTCLLPLLSRPTTTQRLSRVNKNALFQLLRWMPETVGLAAMSQCQLVLQNLVS